MNLQIRFEQNWHLQKFPSKGQQILLATSGGKDSMALAHLLLTGGHSFAIAHCNFQLRGDDSDQDEKLVIDWGIKNSIEVHHIAFDTQEEMALHKAGIQETARKLRYNWFRELCKTHQYAAIATAHHANDNAETLLINLCKGTGIAGLHGIPVKNDNVIRPLLFASRQEIDDYVLAHNMPFREDLSNQSTKYLRNAVRHNIIPALNEIFPEVVQKINDTILRMNQVETLYKSAVLNEKKKLIEQRGNDIYLPILKLKKTPAYESICYEIFSEYGFNAAQNAEILRLLDSESGHYVASNKHRVIKNRNFLIITTAIPESADLILIETLPFTIDTNEGTIIFSVLEEKFEIDNTPNIALIDYNSIKLPLTLRKKRAGDYFYPIGMDMKKKKISRFLIDQKVPIHLKERVWIVENNQQIVWLAGLRMDERFKVKSTSKKVIEIHFLPK